MRSGIGKLNPVRLARLVGSGVALILCGCGESRGPLSVANPDPSVKIPAIQQDVRNGSKKDVAIMVHDLDNDDPAVRFYSIEGLERLTGQTFGYKHYFDQEQRKPYVAKWKAWLAERSGEKPQMAGSGR